MVEWLQTEKDGRSKPASKVSKLMIVVAVASPLLSFIGAGGSAYFSYKSSKYQSDTKMVELAVSIIQAPQTSLSMREWALDVLGTYSDVPMPQERKKAIAIEIENNKGVDLKKYNDPLKPAASTSKELIDISKALYTNKKLNWPEQ